MLVQLKSNGRKIEINKDAFDKFSDDAKRNYEILSDKDAPEKVKQTVENTVKEDKPKADKADK